MNKHFFKTMTIASLALIITACDSDKADDDDLEPNLGNNNTIQLDATAGGSRAEASDPANKYTYFDLDLGAVIELTDVEAEANSVWDIAFKRTKTKINGGASGPGNVTAALAEAQDSFYDNENSAIVNTFVNATKDTEKSVFDGFTDSSALVFETDVNTPKIDGTLSGDETWALYNLADNTVSAQPTAWHIIKSADGSSYAKFHVTDIVQASRDITVELFIQGAADTEFSETATTWTANIGAGGGSLCYDLETTSEVNCTTAATTWDLMLEVTASGFGWNIWSNGGINGDGSGGGAMTLGSFATPADFTYPGIGDESGQLPSRYLEKDAPTGVFLDNSWYAYGLQGGHNLWPNYRVFSIDLDSANPGQNVYKLQYLSYYNDAGTSGHLTIRFEAL